MQNARWSDSNRHRSYNKIAHLLSRSNAKETWCNLLNNLNDDQCDIMTVESPFGKTTLFCIQKNESVVNEQVNPDFCWPARTKQKGLFDISTIKYMVH